MFVATVLSKDQGRRRWEMPNECGDTRYKNTVGVRKVGKIIGGCKENDLGRVEHSLIPQTENIHHTHTHRDTDTDTKTQTHRHTNTQTHNHTNKHTHKYTHAQSPTM